MLLVRSYIEHPSETHSYFDKRVALVRCNIQSDKHVVMLGFVVRVYSIGFNAHTHT